MADSTTCLIHGTLKKIEEGIGDNAWTHFFIDVGREYPVKLSTKKDTIIAEAKSMGTEMASWKYEFSYGGPNPHRPGERFKNRYLSAAKQGQHGTPTREPEDTGEVASGQQQLNTSTPGTQPAQENVDWDEKDRRDFMSRAWAQTISAHPEGQRGDESPDQYFARLQAFQRKIYSDITGAWGAERAQSYYPDALRSDPAQSAPQNSEPAHTGPDDRDLAQSEEWQSTQPVDDDIPF